MKFRFRIKTFRNFEILRSFIPGRKSASYDLFEISSGSILWPEMGRIRESPLHFSVFLWFTGRVNLFIRVVFASINRIGERRMMMSWGWREEIRRRWLRRWSRWRETTMWSANRGGRFQKTSVESRAQMNRWAVRVRHCESVSHSPSSSFACQLLAFLLLFHNAPFKTAPSQLVVMRHPSYWVRIWRPIRLIS